MKERKIKYNTIVIDPPWDISMTGEVKREENRAKKLPYKTMSLKQIKEFPLQDFAEQGSHIYCWTTNKMLRETFKVLDSWGVNFHLVLVWNKPSGICPCFAYQFATEFCILGFYGKPMKRFIGQGKKNWIQGFNKAGKHSAKPSAFYNLVREMSPSPRIDIFSRQVNPGFDNWGDEAPNEKQQILADNVTKTQMEENK